MATAYSAQTYASSFRIKRWSHAARFDSAVKVANPKSHEAILDYGAGDAHLLATIMDNMAIKSSLAYEPVLWADAQRNLAGRAAVVSNVEGIPEDSFDIVFCMEVLEHLSPENQRVALRNMLRAGKADCRFVVTVPIETGFPSIVKNAVRVLANPGSIPFKDAFNAAIGNSAAIHRSEHRGYIATHLGFDHRSIVPLLKDMGLKVTGTSYSPISLFGGIANSQVTYLARRQG